MKLQYFNLISAEETETDRYNITVDSMEDPVGGPGGSMAEQDAADDDDAEEEQEIDLRDQFDDPPPIPTTSEEGK